MRFEWKFAQQKQVEKDKLKFKYIVVQNTTLLPLIKHHIWIWNESETSKSSCEKYDCKYLKI